MASHEPAAPFTEEVLTFGADEFPFLPHVRYMLGQEDESKSLENLCVADRPQLKGALLIHNGFRETYHRFVRDYLRKHLEEDILVFEANPNLRIHFAHSKSPTGPHTDGDYQHSPYEINFWVPVTAATGTASLWAESSPGRGDFHTFEASYGQAVRFYGSRCLHFTRDNKTDLTRVSFDFRIVRLRDFFASGIPLQGTSNARFELFSYYHVMGPHGVISEDNWESLSQVHPVSLQPHVDVADTLAAVTVPSNESMPGRTRSPSVEHRQRCCIEWGSERDARLNCARCAWIQNRCSLMKSLAYVDCSGDEVPWVAENPDLTAPWGLGCLICNAVHTKGLDKQMPRSAFSDFTFASGPSGVLCGYQPLFRHGNCARNQHQRGQQTHMPRLAFDEGHQISLREFGAKHVEGAKVQPSLKGPRYNLPN